MASRLLSPILAEWIFFSVCVTAFMMNSFVLVVIWKDPKKCLRTRSAMLVTSLIISDLIVALVNIARTVCGVWFEGQFPKQLGIALVIVSHNGLMISFLTIFLISVEHLLAITQPIKFKLLFTKKWVLIIIIFTWLGCTGIVYVAYHLPGKQNELFSCITASSVLLFIALPTVYTRAFWSLRQQSKAIRAMNNTSCSEKLGKQNEIRRQRNFLLTCALLVLTYLFTCTPFTFHHYVKTTEDENYNMRRDKDSLGAIFWIILHLNLIFDSFLYCLRIPQYRKSCAALMCKYYNYI